MDHRKNFVRAIKIAADLDQVLAQLDSLLLESAKLGLSHVKHEIDTTDYQYALKEIGKKRKKILEQYSQIKALIQQIQDEYGGEIRS